MGVITPHSLLSTTKKGYHKGFHEGFRLFFRKARQEADPQAAKIRAQGQVAAGLLQ